MDEQSSSMGTAYKMSAMSAMSSAPQVNHATIQHKSPVVYGELVILGYNGVLEPMNRGRKRSKYTLRQRYCANGIKYSKHYVVQDSQQLNATLPTKDHAALYKFSQYDTVVVEYELDKECDMFQIGRCSETANDIVVLERPRGEINSEVFHSAISRFACRIQASRSNPHIVRIYAGGFDSSRKLFLGENAIKLQKKCGSISIDGLTTNGVMVCHPRGSFFGGDAEVGPWYELSVNGDLLSLRKSRSDHQPGEIAEDQTNVLQDGSLIDLCGVTLMWRSAEMLKVSPTSHTVKSMVNDTNAGWPQCPEDRNTVVIPRKRATPDEGGRLPQVDVRVRRRRLPYVYLRCGHVQGLHGLDEAAGDRCPKCLEMGPVVQLIIGIEPALYVDMRWLIYAFDPCGHVTTKKTVKFWASVLLPRGLSGFEAACPFCGTPLNDSPGYVRLIY